MSTIPIEVAALVKKAERIAGEQRACFHDWEFIEGTIIRKELHRVYDVWPRSNQVIDEYITELAPVGHHHCKICNMRTYKLP